MRNSIIFLSLFAATISPIDRWATATGGREKIAAIRSVYREGTLETGGLTGTLQSWETSDGKYREEVQIATFSSVETFDGANGIVQEGSSPAHKMAGADLARAFTQAYGSSYAMFFPDRRAGSVKADGNTITIKPEGGIESQVMLDPETSLPKTLTRHDADRMTTATITAYETIDGVKFAKEIRQSTGDAHHDTLIHFTKTVINPPIEASLFTIAPKAATTSIVTWPEGKHVVTIPFELAQNHIYIPLSVNGKPPSWFVYDTGADGSVIDADHAKALGLATKGHLEGRGAGPNTVDVSLVEKPTLSFGGVSMPLNALASLPLRNVSLLEGRDMQGVLGYNVTSHFITDIDYAKRELRMYEPAAYTPSAHATALPLTFLGNLPIVNAKITMRDGRTFNARFLVDTGARNAVVLNRPFIEKNDVARSIGPFVEGPLGMGVGGASTQKVGRLKSIELAGFTLKDPITSFATGNKGAEANADVDGLIGGEILKRFAFTVDYPHERFLLEPNGALDDPFEYGMSGLLFAASDAKFDRVVVRNVLPGSPAASSGIKVGDELQSIDGKLATSMSLDALRALLLQEGETRTLTLLRGGKPVTVTLTLKRLV